MVSSIKYHTVMLQVIVLSPDATEALEQLSGSEVYCIGGIVDRSVRRYMSFDYAVSAHTLSSIPVCIKHSCAHRHHLCPVSVTRAAGCGHAVAAGVFQSGAERRCSTFAWSASGYGGQWAC